MEFVIENGFIIQPEQNMSFTNLVINESTQISVPDSSITIPRNSGKIYKT